MQEPAFYWSDGRRVPFSEAPNELLRDVISGACPAISSVPGTVGPSDRDVGVRYATILLHERAKACSR